MITFLFLCFFFFFFFFLFNLLYFSYQPAEVRTFFGDHGIELTEAETKSIFFVFDSNDDKKLSRKEFMNFASQAQTSTLNPTSEFWVKLLARDDDQSRDSRVATIAEWDDGERDKCLRELKELASKNLPIKLWLSKCMIGTDPANIN